MTTPEVTSAASDSPSRFVVGIDLGTTNSAATLVDTSKVPWRVETFAVPQLVARGEVEGRETLPSFHYEPAAGEMDDAEYVGFFARDQGAATPGRVIASAKSWLCHSGVDRTAAILPWQGAEDVTRLSPVDVSSRYLAHVREAFDARFPDERLAEQEIVITLPASFDEVARELTVKAAAQAGLPRVVLIEEPQAAFYAWIDAHSGDWEQLVRPGQTILVCDIGGGTSDFTLIRVRRGEEEKVQFARVAVGDHLILGGDNLDLALAQHVERRLKGDGKLAPRQWSVLVGGCRHVKETLLGRDAPQQVTLNLPGEGARLIGGGVQVEITRREAHQVLLEGFFPHVAINERPQVRQSGFQEFGLPYAPDPAITRYLAAFLATHGGAGWEEADEDADKPHADPSRPDIVLFNGGLFESPVLRQRMIDVISSWSRTKVEPEWTPLELKNERLDLAVAHGASYYGLVRRGHGVRIAAGLARTYYVGVQSDDGNAAQAVCLAPAGIEPGQDIDLTQRTFHLQVAQPVEFPLYVSSTRLTDSPGELVPVDREQMTSLPPIRTVLRTRKKGEADEAEVNLHARLSQIGTLDLWCSEADGPRSWRLQFDVRSATQTDVTAHEGQAESEGFIDEQTWREVEALIETTFGPNGGDPPERLMKRLTAAVGTDRHSWPTSLLRRVWEVLLRRERGRRRGASHEARWLNLLGFALRPGYGLAMDDWRLSETWRQVQGKLIHAGGQCRAEWWILWRRIGGGLSPGQQQALADPLLGPVRALHRKYTTGKGRVDASLAAHESAEMWRLLGSLELLPLKLKIELGRMVIDLLGRRKLQAVRPALAWTLSRVGARQPVYGPLNSVVPAEEAGEWLGCLIDLDYDGPMGQLAAMQLARRTNDRYRDLGEKQRESALNWLRGRGAPRHFTGLVRHGGELQDDEQKMVFGESLPSGLKIK